MKATGVNMNAVIVSNSQNLAEEALKLFIGDAKKAIEARGRFCVAISRHIPGLFFELLGDRPQSKALRWDRIHLFWVDERCDSPDSGNSSNNPAENAFIPKVNIPAENIHRICSGNWDCDCGYVAAIYGQTIRNVVKAKKNGTPRFDLIVLGMGTDGHIASLFPDTYTFFDTEDIVRVMYFMDGRHTRITLTNPVLRAAFHIAVLVWGEEKAAILREVFTSEPDEVRYPIHAIWPILDKVTWLVDREATRFLRRGRLSNKVLTRSMKPIESYKRL